MNSLNLIIGPAFPLRGGIAHFNLALCRAFNQFTQTHSEIISFQYQYPQFLFPGTSQFENGTPPADITIHTKLHSLNPFNWYKTAKFILDLSPSYIIVRYWLPFMSPCLSTVMRIIKSEKKIKIIALMDNVIPHEKRIGDRLLTTYFINKADAFIVMSAASVEQLKIFTSNPKILFLHHPLYDIFGPATDKISARKKLLLNSDGKYILFFGMIRKYKGLDLLLRAMAESPMKDSGIKLIIAGEYYDDKKYYHQLTDELKIRDTIIEHSSFIPHLEVANYFCAADLVVQPYHHATQSGVSQISLNYNKPIVVTDTGGLSEIVINEKSGYIVDKAPSAISDAILKYFNENKEKEMSEFISKDKNRFSWKNFVTKTEEFIKAL